MIIKKKIWREREREREMVFSTTVSRVVKERKIVMTTMPKRA